MIHKKNLFKKSELILTINIITCDKNKTTLPTITTIDETENSYTTAASGGKFFIVI